MTTFTGTKHGDRIVAGSGKDIDGFTGGTLRQLNDAIGDTILGRGGDDLILAGGGNDALLGGDGNDVLDPGGNAPDAFGIGFEILIGGEGNDTVKIGAANAHNVLVDYAGEDGARGVTVDLATGKATDTFGDKDRLRGITSVIGSDGDDHFTGAGTDDFFMPIDGADTIDGGDGSDTLSYGVIAQYALDFASDQGITVNMGPDDDAGTVIDPNGEIDTFSHVEHIVGTRNDDTFNGNLFDAWFSGGAGADTFNGGLSGDTVDYSLDVVGGGKDGVFVNLDTEEATDGFGDHDALHDIRGVVGTQLADTVVGSRWSDRLVGGAGRDRIDGNSGADVIVGGPGADLLSAGFTAGHPDHAQDRFVFNSVAEIGKGASRDKVFDFEVGFGGDLIDLVAIDASTRRHGNQDFKAIFDAPFHHKAGELRVLIGGAIAHISGDVDGDGRADFRLDVQSGFGFSADNLRGIIPEN